VAAEEALGAREEESRENGCWRVPGGGICGSE
jgi:hypothetical protein